MPVAQWPTDAFLVLFRWIHALATVAFLGWTAVYLLDPRHGPQNLRASARFKEVTELTLLVFLASGAVLSFDRLSHGAGSTYAVLLAAKVLVAVVSFQFAFRWRRGGMRVQALDGRLALAFGAGAVLLAAILKEVFERGVRSGV